MNENDYKKIQSAISLAINHLAQEGSDDIFRLPVFAEPVERSIVSNNLEDFRKKALEVALDFLKACDLNNKPIGQTQNFLIPKDQFTFRRVAWIDPFDLVKYLSLCILLFDEIETARIPVGGLSRCIRSCYI